MQVPCIAAAMSAHAYANTEFLGMPFVTAIHHADLLRGRVVAAMSADEIPFQCGKRIVVFERIVVA